MAARLQLLISSALVWLIFLFGATTGGIPPLLPTLLLSAWIVASTLWLALVALRASLDTLNSAAPGRIALLCTLITIVLATLLIRDTASDFYLLYFFLIGVATIYYGVRGGCVAAACCALSYVGIAWAINQNIAFDFFSMLAARSVLLFAFAGTLGVSAEGQIALRRELQMAYDDLQATAKQNAELVSLLDAQLEELQKAQAQLLHTERLRAVGEMTSGIAHDFNNYLTVIAMEAQLLDHALEGDSRAGVRRILTAARESADVVRRLREYTRPRSEPISELVAVDSLLKEVVAITRPRWAPIAKFNLDVRETGEVKGSARELREALMNLIFNAVEARREHHALEIILRAWCDAQSWQVIEIDDNGVGVAGENQQRIFDPYYTTKRNGTGLGLSITYNFVARHGGEIQVTSPLFSTTDNPSYGTRFAIRLPPARQTK